ncbi:MAG TPA: HIRAN domain-containing protein [Nocardioides sp.]|uniref:HIRAN domain-containing protein n=1 Tax=Nocardioides sp. TaxID=35761 RepID=UPI002F41F41E
MPQAVELPAEVATVQHQRRGVFGRRKSTLRSQRQTEEQRAPSIAELVASMRHEPHREPLLEQIEVAGETYHVKGIARVFGDLGLPITDAGCTAEDLTCILVPEPWNEHDPNAVAVAVGEHHVGYLPADIAVDYAPPLLQLGSTNTLATGLARIWAKSDAGMIRARVTIRIPECDACW